MESWKYDIAVLCIFFARPAQFRETFEQVRKARPRVLLLWQDGARDDRPDDVENIMKCREIAENIDWDCEVHRLYNEKNYGCDPSTFYSYKWAFSIVDKCIILEDDVKVSPEFFPFCKELLDKYENDTRVCRICSANYIEDKINTKYSYYFSSNGTGPGWATWKRVADLWDENYTFLDNKELMDNLYNKECQLGGHARKAYEQYLGVCEEHRNSKVAHWETILSFSAMLNSQLVIVPKVNMVRNVGISGESTHSLSTIDFVPNELRAIYSEPKKTMEFPLSHPETVGENVNFTEECLKFSGSGYALVRLRRKFESLILRISHGDFSAITKRLTRNK